ncbi:hypothetical protein GCM10007092_16220 [Thermus composti]|uniref:MFS transporter n=1 Tax=Thermus composti TaxID=532059 RepID=A0ABV6Q257_9DEIN|nr:hypothetical protein [Thermus composti]GGN02660.1 hypothetical protein GCM10007092_16220 [Thermus composti]
MARVLASEALGDLGAALGFSALALEVARTGEAFWVGLFAALGYFTLGPLLLLSPRLDRGDPVRALLLRLLRTLPWLLFPFLPREAPLLVLSTYPLMVFTDLGVVAWDTLLVRFRRKDLVEHTGKLYAAWNTGSLLGGLLGPALLLVHPALPYLLAFGVLALSLLLLLPLARERAREAPVPRGQAAPLGRALRFVLGDRRLRPYLALSLLFAAASALATGLLGLVVLQAGTPEGLFGLFFALQDLGVSAGSYYAGRIPLKVALLGGPALVALGLLLLALPFPPFLAGGLLYGFAVGVTGVHLRAVRGWLLPEEALAGSLAALRALIYGAGALGGTLSGILGGIGVTLPLRVALASFLAFYLFALGPLHPRRLEEVEAMGKAS